MPGLYMIPCCGYRALKVSSSTCGDGLRHLTKQTHTRLLGLDSWSLLCFNFFTTLVLYQFNLLYYHAVHPMQDIWVTSPGSTCKAIWALPLTIWPWEYVVPVISPYDSGAKYPYVEINILWQRYWALFFLSGLLVFFSVLDALILSGTLLH